MIILILVHLIGVNLIKISCSDTLQFSEQLIFIRLIVCYLNIYLCMYTCTCTETCDIVYIYLQIDGMIECLIIGKYIYFSRKLRTDICN